jgi:hypothetical protein
MSTTLDLRPIASLEDRHLAVRDFLYGAGAGRWTSAALRLVYGTRAVGTHPRLVTPVDPLIGRDGSYLPDIVVLSVDLDPWRIGSARLGDVDMVQLEGHDESF